MEINFQDVLKSLNERQMEAVTTTEGPVMVLAGPGTGKTQILAARVGQILRGADIDAANILCLTYTDAGAVAMRNRLIRFIGPEAHRVHIHTFHSFCNWVIQSNPDHFPGTASEPMSDLEKVEIAEDILNRLPSDHPLKTLKGSNRPVSQRLLELMQIMKSENWPADEVKSIHDAYLKALPDMEKVRYKRAYKGFKKGDVNERILNTCIESVAKLVPAASLYSAMEAEKTKRGLFDFADMILWVTDAFAKHENLLRDYQERFLYIMVDEYQDTSGSQQRLINLLSSYWESPNLFVVGDDDQSIYRFQGANVQNIIDFHNKYDKFMTLIVLTDNYRSTQKILDVARQLIEHNASRLINVSSIGGLTKDLNAIYRSDEEANVQLHTYPNPVHEAVDTGLQIRALIDRGVPTEEIAVLYRSHKESEELIRYLRLYKIPIRTRRKANVLELSIVSNYIDAIKYVVAEAGQPGAGEGLLFRILHFDSAVEPLDVAKISLWIDKERRESRYHSLREVLEMVREGKGPFPQLKNPKSIAGFSKNIEHWISLYFSATAIELAEAILHRGGFVAFALRSDRKGFLLEALHTIFGFIQTEARKDPTSGIAPFIQKLDLMNEHHLPLEIEEIINDQSGVQFSTAHSSKGLEFGHVFIIGCVKNSWEKSRNDKPFGLHNLIEGDPEDVVSEENRRLFYVAMTRAKTTLTVSTYTNNLNGKNQEVSTFFSEIETTGHVTSVEKQAPPEEIEAFLIRTGQESDTRLTHILDDDLLDSRLSNYRLSVTHLNTYLRCPVDFYFTGLLRVPAMKNKYMSYGTAVHTALDRLIKVIQTKDYNENYLIRQFEWTMNRERSAFTNQEFEDMLEAGRQNLSAFFNKYHEDWQRPDKQLTEQNIDNVLVNGVPVKGQLDKIEFFGNDVNVVDYKTGQPENARDKLKPPSADADESSKPEARYGGDYWRQLVFYYLLIKGQKDKPWRMISGEMDFVESQKDGEFKKHKWFINDEDEKTVTTQITTVYQQIMNREFNRGCNDEKCVWCNFVNDHLKQRESEE